MDGNLGNNVGGCAEPVDAEMPDIPAHHAVRPVPYQPGAQQGGRLRVTVRGGQGKAVPVVGDGVVRIAAVNGVAGEEGVVAEVFMPGFAGAAMAAGVAQPGYADPVPGAERDCRAACLDDGADDLMAGDEGQLRMGQLAVHHVKVGTADAAGVDAHQYLVRPRLRDGQLPFSQAACPALRAPWRALSVLPCVALLFF